MVYDDTWVCIPEGISQQLGMPLDNSWKIESSHFRNVSMFASSIDIVVPYCHLWPSEIQLWRFLIECLEQTCQTNSSCWTRVVVVVVVPTVTPLVKLTFFFFLLSQSLNAALFYNNPDARSYVSLVPTSAHTGDGMGDLISQVVKLTQLRLAQRLAFSEEMQSMVLEVRVNSPRVFPFPILTPL